MNEWSLLNEYAAAYEADLHASLLKAAGIPFMVKGPETGVFGPGFAGPTSRGVELHVPSDRVDEARETVAGEEEPQTE